MKTRSPSVGRRGFSLIELMITLVVLSLVMGSAVSLLSSQNKYFRRSGDQLEMSQSLRHAAMTVERALRTTGAGVASEQPMFVYGGPNVVVFNTNYWASIPDGCAVNLNPDAPAGALDVLPVGQAFVVPNTAYTYPSMTYTAGGLCAAETIMFFLRPDSATADANDFALFQKVNALPAELVARNLYAFPGRPFFEYFVHVAPPSTGRDSLVIAGTTGSGVALPIIHTQMRHGALADTGIVAVADSVKAVRVNMQVSNGRTGIDRRTRDVAAVTYLPNNGLVQLRTCGSAPIFTGNVTAVASLPGLSPNVRLTWPASIDENAGETDVPQYLVYRRLVAAPLFGDPIATVPAGQLNYTWDDGSVDPATTYVYGITAQDCTPSESAMRVSPAVTTPL
jgi:prepilin-type N-terminal cleavage/methylation domain-containing protein